MQSIIEYKEKRVSIAVPRHIRVISELMSDFGIYSDDAGLNSGAFGAAYEYLQDFYQHKATLYFGKPIVDSEFMEKIPEMGKILDYVVVYDLEDFEQ